MAASNNFPVPHPTLSGGVQSNDGIAMTDELAMLPSDFEPSDDDVICQRGKDSFEHVGNKRFRELVNEHLDSYLKAGSRQEKSTIVARIYDHIIRKAIRPSKGFVRKDLLTRRWFLVNEKEARDKVGQALRDAIKILRADSKKLCGASKNAVATAARSKGKKRSIGSVERTTNQVSSSEGESNSPSSMVARLFEPQNRQIGSLHFNANAWRAGIDMRNLPMPPNMLNSAIEPLCGLESFKNARMTEAQSDNGSNKLSSSGMFAKGINQHGSVHGQEFMASSNVSPHLSILSQNRPALDAGRSSAMDHKQSDLLRYHVNGLDAASPDHPPGTLPTLMQHQVNNITTEQANGFIQGLTGIQGFWDLEPTPLMGVRRTGSDEE